MRVAKVIVEKHADGYLAYPVGLRGTVVAQGSSFEEVLGDVKSATLFHLQAFPGALDTDDPELEMFIAEISLD